MHWLLILTCACGMPKQAHFATHEACFRAAQNELYDRNINVPSYRCEEKR